MTTASCMPATRAPSAPSPSFKELGSYCCYCFSGLGGRTLMGSLAAAWRISGCFWLVSSGM